MTTATEAPLLSRIRARIRADGPITIAEFMSICLSDPEHGYYMTADPFGVDGDFITAPEVSQMFGELIGIWCLDVWEKLGCPGDFQLIELGPGRGTLMRDALRAAELNPEFQNAANITLVETSNRLRDIQAKTLWRIAAEVTWRDRLDDTTDAPLLLIANEFFDALPVRQYVRQGGRWRERVIGIGGDDRLVFGLGPGTFSPAEDAEYLASADEGAIFEISPARNGIMSAIAGRIREFGGAALIIDYGHARSEVGDTLQAVRNHQFAGPLADPGLADLTSHVDFEALCRAAASEGAITHGPATQGDFLIGLGLLERAGALGADKDPETQTIISDAVERLAGSEQMGHLFKVLAVTSADLTPSPFDNGPEANHSLTDQRLGGGQ